MLLAFLANTGAPVEIPEAVECIECDDPSYVAFVDARGRSLARFRRADVSMFATPEQASALNGSVLPRNGHSAPRSEEAAGTV